MSVSRLIYEPEQTPRISKSVPDKCAPTEISGQIHARETPAVPYFMVEEMIGICTATNPKSCTPKAVIIAKIYLAKTKGIGVQSWKIQWLKLTFDRVKWSKNPGTHFVKKKEYWVLWQCKYLVPTEDLKLLVWCHLVLTSVIVACRESTPESPPMSIG